MDSYELSQVEDIRQNPEAALRRIKELFAMAGGPKVDTSPSQAPSARPPVEAYGREFARFRIAGDLTIRVLTPAPGDPEGVRLEVILGPEHGQNGPDGEDHRTSTVAFLTKARERALASAIMGAAAEL